MATFSNTIFFILLLISLSCSAAQGEGNGQICNDARGALFPAQFSSPTASAVELENNLGGYCPNEEASPLGGSNDDAWITYQKTLRNSPGNAEIHYKTGILLEQKGDLNGAIDAYQQSISLDNNNGAAHQRLAEIYTLRGKHAKAIAEYRELIKLTPDNPAIHFRLGKAYKKAGKFNESAKSFEAAIRLDPADLEPRRELIKLEVKRKNLLGAEKLCRGILMINRDDQQERSRLIGILGREKKYDELAHFLAEEINRYPTESVNYYRLGIVRELLRDYRAAIEAFLKSIEIKATASAYYAVARVYLSVPDINKAREALVQAKLLEPKRQDIKEMFEIIDGQLSRNGSDKIPVKTKK